MADKTAQEFVLDVLVEGLGVDCVVVGADFQFGKGRAGNTTVLAYMGEMEGFGVDMFEPVIGRRRRQDLLHADPRCAESAAGPKRPRACSAIGGPSKARVEHGDKRGRTIGFPDREYAARRLCSSPLSASMPCARRCSKTTSRLRRYDGVANFGIRPMFETQTPLLETFLFDFDGDLYGKHLAVDAGRLYPPRSQARRAWKR